jgi:hypothetical protein
LDQSIDGETVVDPNVPSPCEFEPRELRALVRVVILDDSNGVADPSPLGVGFNVVPKEDELENVRLSRDEVTWLVETGTGGGFEEPGALESMESNGSGAAVVVCPDDDMPAFPAVR